MGYRIVVVRTVYEFFRHVEMMGAGQDGMWYRGEAYHSYELAPSAYRSKKYVESSQQLEQVALLEAQSAMGHIEEARHLAGPLEWWCYLQHNGMPTRLLDWTTDPQTALYFAFEDYLLKKSTPGSMPAIWCLNSIAFFRGIEAVIRDGTWPVELEPLERAELIEALFLYKNKELPSLRLLAQLDQQTHGLLDKVYVPFVSPLLNERARAQGSCFIRFPLLDGQPAVAFENHKLNRFVSLDRSLAGCCMKCVFINPNAARQGLSALNIKTRNVYPEVQNIALDVKQRFF